MTDLATRTGWLDSANEVTKSNLVNFIVFDGYICADCDQCGASSYWTLEEAPEAAHAIREHHGDRCER